MLGVPSVKFQAFIHFQQAVGKHGLWYGCAWSILSWSGCRKGENTSHDYERRDARSALRVPLVL